MFSHSSIVSLIGLWLLLCSSSTRAQFNQIWLNDTLDSSNPEILRLSSLRSIELIDRPARATTGAVLNTSLIGRELVAEGGRLELMQLPDFIEREVVIRWKAPLNGDDWSTKQLLEAEWICSGGEPGAAVVDGVRVASGIQTEVSQPRRMALDASSETWEALVRIRIPLEALSRAGDLEGSLILDCSSE